MGLYDSWPSRTGVPPSRQWTSLRLLAILVSFAAASASRDLAGEEAATGPRPDCTTCGGSGKATCGNCSGRGEIWKPCPLCSESGRKPCPVCASDESRGASPGPGRRVCTLCGGKGIRASGRTCSRCLGEQTVTCMTCIGKGTLPCRRQVFDKVCPLCRFVGKVDCPTCRGGPAGPPAAKRARAPEPDPGASKAAAGDLEARHERIKGLYLSHMDIFGDDPRPGLEPIRAEASSALKRLKAAGAAEVPSAEAIESFLSRLASFRRRWAEIRELFLDEHRAFRTAEGVRGSRERLVEDAKGVERAAAEKQWSDRMDIALTIAEQRGAALEAAEPTWLPKEATDLRAIWSDLRASAESEIARADAAVKARPDAARANATADAGIENGAEEADPAEAMFSAFDEEVARGEPTGDLRAEAAASSSVPSPPATAPPPARRPEKEPPRSRDPAPPADDVAEEGDDSPAGGTEEDPPSRRSWAPILWSAAGFAAATIVFGLLGRRGRFRARG